MKSLLPHLAAELVKGLTAQSSAEAEPTTISAQSSASPLYVHKIIVNSQASNQLHEHDLQERQSQHLYAHPPPHPPPPSPHPQKKKKIDNLRANILA